MKKQLFFSLVMLNCVLSAMEQEKQKLPASVFVGGALVMRSPKILPREFGRDIAKVAAEKASMPLLVEPIIAESVDKKSILIKVLDPMCQIISLQERDESFYKEIQAFALPSFYTVMEGPDRAVLKYDNSAFGVKVENEELGEPFWCVYQVNNPEKHIEITSEKIEFLSDGRIKDSANNYYNSVTGERL